MIQERILLVEVHCSVKLILKAKPSPGVNRPMIRPGLNNDEKTNGCSNNGPDSNRKNLNSATSIHRTLYVKYQI